MGFILIQCNSVEPYKMAKSLAVILLFLFLLLMYVRHLLLLPATRLVGNLILILALQYRGPPRSFGEQGKGHLFQGSKGQMLKGTGEQRQYLVTGNIKIKFSILGELGNKPIYFRGTGKQVSLPPGRASIYVPRIAAKLIFVIKHATIEVLFQRYYEK